MENDNRMVAGIINYLWFPCRDNRANASYKRDNLWGYLAFNKIQNLERTDSNYMEYCLATKKER